MICTECNDNKLKLYHFDRWICTDCLKDMQKPAQVPDFPYFKQTVHYPNYFKNNGNVSKARCDMIRKRRLHPDGNGEVVLTDRMGRPTNRLAKEV